MESAVLSAAPTSQSADLAPGENLLLSGLRVWAAARCSGDRPHGPLSKALAQRTSPRVAALFLAWVQAIEAASLRPIHAECPHCGGAGADIQRLVVACGVAPVALDVGERLIAPLVSEPRPVMVLARSLNAALAGAGWPLPARLGEPSEPGAAHRTLH